MQSFPKSVTDDCVDAMTQALVNNQKRRGSWDDVVVVGPVRAGYDLHGWLGTGYGDSHYLDGW